MLGALELKHIEQWIKRDSSGKDQDLQAIRYASFASTLSSDDVVELHRDYRHKEHGRA